MSKNKHQKYRVSGVSPAPNPTSQIPSKPRVPYKAMQPVFSFKYLEEKHNRYGLHAIRSKGEWQQTISRLKHISQTTWGVMEGNYSAYHANAFDWMKSHEKSGFQSVPSNLKGSPPYEFKVFDEFRITGFFNDENVFEIVWLDRDHRVFPDPSVH